MKKLVCFVLTAGLLLGLCAAPALAANEGKAWDAYCAFLGLEPYANPEVRARGQFNFLLGWFLLDMDGDGVPEMITRHGQDIYSPYYHVSEDECISVWRYNGVSAERLSGYPATAQWDGDTADSLYTSIGASGGTFGAIVIFEDGTYGLYSRTSNYGYEKERIVALVNGKFQPTDKKWTKIYHLGSANTFPAEHIFPTPEEVRPVAFERDQHIRIYSEGAHKSWDARFTTYAVKEGNGETNYIRVRDLAAELKDTPAAFEVTWNGAVNLLPGQAYTLQGTEGSIPFSGPMTYTALEGGTLVNGEGKSLSAIRIQDAAGNGYTYYKLRDLADVLGFKVTFNPYSEPFIGVSVP